MNDVSNEILEILSPYQNEFLKIELSRGLESYISRINYIGLNNQGRVLDAGGGIGQWGLALSKLNSRVDVIDILSERLFVGHHLASRNDNSNLFFKYGSIEKIPFEDSTFDAIICYSVFMFANKKIAIKEFYRVLKPNGKLYIMVDLWRWYLGEIFQNKRELFKFIIKKVLTGKPTFYTKKSFSSLIKNNGFKIVSEGQEGFAKFENSNNTKIGSCKFYDTNDFNNEKLWEICAVKV